MHHHRTEQGEHGNVTKRNCTRVFSFGYITWLLLACFTVLNLYLDYQCSYNNIIPATYFHIPNQNPGILSNGMVKRSVPDQTSFNNSSTNSTYQCQDDSVCGNGVCEPNKNIDGTVIGSECDCDTEYISIDNDMCNYHQLSGLVALLLSIFLGGCGIDRCFLSRGNGCCICLGILKGITLGGFGIWYIIDIVLIATANLNDGNGYPLSSI